MSNKRASRRLPVPHFNTVVERRYSRRSILRGSIGAALTGLFAGLPLPLRGELGAGLNAELRAGQTNTRSRELPAFAAIPTSDADEVRVPPGYVARPFLPWGTPICGDYPEYRPDAGNSGAQQECQMGSHHDGMHFFPCGEGEERNRHGLLCVNHEYVDLHKLHPHGATIAGGRRTVPDEVRKELAAHGVAIVEIRATAHGHWEVVRGRYNRRITGSTPMVLTGPVRGSSLVHTRYSPDGTRTRGTLSNCAHGATPWNTYLTCEENWSGCFVNRGELPREHARYGVRTRQTYNHWETLSDIDEYARFDATARGARAVDDYRNEPNTQGWVVEIDPFDPASTPKKRTALGRFAHEGAVLAPARDGAPVVLYSGDDSRNEYIYKFVSASPYRSNGDNRDLLEQGTLYVAVFQEDGQGEWRALDCRCSRFQAAAAAAGVTFENQADVLVNTRLAADVLGATPMDRPEWGAVHPHSGEVYFSLTNNRTRGTPEYPVDAANPRANNRYGHIIRWRERDGDAAALRFSWEVFVLAGPGEVDPATTNPDESGRILPGRNGPPLGPDNRFGCPDGLWIDGNGLLWIQTDLDSEMQLSERERLGNNQMLAANPATGTIRRFLVGPRGQEITGITCTPDHRTFFINVQHPGEGGETHPELVSHWPDGHGARPRSATVIVTREDGGVIGT